MTQLVRDFGEFALIKRLISALPDAARGPDRVHGQQDDCAWWDHSAGATVVTTDALVENVHFRLDWTDWRSLGHKMLAVNLSDLASMGVTPRTAFVTLALTGDEEVADLEDLYRGAGELAAIYDVAIAGGDIVRTSGPIVLSVTAIGEQPQGDPVMTRSAAQVGDIVMVSGTIGASAAGLRLLQSPRDAATADLLIGAHLRPSPRVSLGQELLAAGVRSCMDLSDGLNGDLPKILEQSQVGAEIDLDALPVLSAVRALFPQNWQELATDGGEDYELLCTVPAEIVDDVMARAKKVGATMSAIGEIVALPGLRYRSGNREVDSPGNGAWDHFDIG